MLPELQLGTEIAGGSLVLLEERAHHDVAPHWQTWTPDSERLHRINAAGRRPGRRQLRATQRDGRSTASRRS